MMLSVRTLLKDDISLSVKTGFLALTCVRVGYRLESSLDYRLMCNVAPEVVELHFAQEGGHGLRRQTLEQHVIASDRHPCAQHSHHFKGEPTAIVQSEEVTCDRQVDDICSHGNGTVDACDL
eukprot:1161916-Pelagomonas_calceolata.AAC.3